MSHFTKVATKINSLPAFYKALDKLELPYSLAVGDGAVAAVSGYLHESIAAKASIHVCPHYDIGVVMGSDGNYELAADWWGIETTTGKTEREIVDEISRAYSHERVMEACEEAGYEISGTEVDDEGQVVLTAECWA